MIVVITADASDFQLNTERQLVLHKEFKYDKKGKLCLSTEYEYDSHGSIIKKITNEVGARRMRYNYYEYDENDNMIKSHQAYSYGDDIYWEYQYDSLGNIVQLTEYDYDGRIYIVNYEYDMHGNLLLMTKTKKSKNDRDVHLVRQECYTYDAQGHLIQLVVTADNYSEELDHYIYTYEYDAQGNLIREIGYFNDGISQHDYEYDSLGNMILETRNHSNKDYANYSCRIQYEYDAQGNLVQESTYNSDGDMTYKKIYTYDMHGKIISEIAYDRYTHSDEFYKSNSHTYRYEYKWINIE